MGEKTHFYGHFVRSNGPLKLVKDLRFIAMFFLKSTKSKNPELFISKKYFFRSENNCKIPL